MAGSRALKNRIRSTKNIRQITRAMEAVSAVKMRKSQAVAIATRPYALTAFSILRAIRASSDQTLAASPLVQKRPVKNSCLVVITSDKGLAGSFNTNVIKQAEKLISQLEHSDILQNIRMSDTGVKVSIVAIGKKGRDYFARRGRTILGEFLGAGDFGAIDETRKISDFLLKLFGEKKTDEVTLVYTNFISALKQEVVVRSILPFSEESLQSIVDSIVPLEGRYANIPRSMELAGVKEGVLKFEPSPKDVLERLLPKFLAVEVYHAILEANASEHSSRMIAMKNASDNAAELAEALNIQFNKNRQAAITKELSEITAGREALSQ